MEKDLYLLAINIPAKIYNISLYTDSIVANGRFLPNICHAIVLFSPDIHSCCIYAIWKQFLVLFWQKVGCWHIHFTPQFIAMPNPSYHKIWGTQKLIGF